MLNYQRVSEHIRIIKDRQNMMIKVVVVALEAGSLPPACATWYRPATSIRFWKTVMLPDAAWVWKKHIYLHVDKFWCSMVEDFDKFSDFTSCYETMSRKSISIHTEMFAESYFYIYIFLHLDTFSQYVVQRGRILHLISTVSGRIAGICWRMKS